MLINLAPASVRKERHAYDQQLDPDLMEGCLVGGERQRIAFLEDLAAYEHHGTVYRSIHVRSWLVTF